MWACLTKSDMFTTLRTFLKLCTKIYMGFFIFSHSLVHRPSLNLRYHHNVMFTPVHAHANSYVFLFS